MCKELYLFKECLGKMVSLKSVITQSSCFFLKTFGCSVCVYFRDQTVAVRANCVVRLHLQHTPHHQLSGGQRPTLNWISNPFSIT